MVYDATIEATNLAELAHVADPLPLQGTEVGGDSAVLEVHQSGEGLVEQGSDGVDREVPSFRLGLLVSPSFPYPSRATYSKGMDHRLEAHVDLAAPDNLGHVGRVIGLQERNLQALILEISPRLSEEQGGMVGSSVPSHG